jgi:neutral ceramidase
MPEIKAGTGRSIITPKVGSLLVGYFNRPDGSKGVHDDLMARALVLDNGETVVALCSIELLWLWGTLVNDIRAKVAARCPLTPENILLACTHTHAGAAPHNTADWETPLTDLVADAIVKAYETRQSARAGFGFGMLYGYSINRRWLNRPMDPSVGVMRVDALDGKPLAIVSNFACHAVVMGYDNYYISGDWAGYSSRHLEAEIGGTALFTQGGAGDVNPLTETVRQRLAAGHPVGSIGELTGYYGGYHKHDPSNWNIEDRGGSTFLECESLALGYNAEVVKVWRTIQTAADLTIRRETLTVNGALSPDEPPAEGLPPEYRNYMPDIQDGYIPLEIMLLRLGQAVFMTQPGEVFSETSVDFRKRAQQIGWGFPWLVSYANGSYAYLPPDNAFNEGGYEVAWARRVGLSRHLQDRITEAILPVLAKLLT